MGGRAFWGSGPCCDASEGEKGQTRTYALLSGHFPQSADEGNHPVALRRSEFSTHSSFSPSHVLCLPCHPLFPVSLFARSLSDLCISPCPIHIFIFFYRLLFLPPSFSQSPLIFSPYPFLLWYVHIHTYHTYIYIYNLYILLYYVYIHIYTYIYTDTYFYHSCPVNIETLRSCKFLDVNRRFRV